MCGVAPAPAGPWVGAGELDITPRLGRSPPQEPWAQRTRRPPRGPWEPASLGAILPRRSGTVKRQADRTPGDGAAVRGLERAHGGCDGASPRPAQGAASPGSGGAGPGPHGFVLEFRAPKEEGGRHEDLAADLARLKVNVIVAATTPAIQAAMGATSTIPIVMATSNDAVEAGLVASLGRSRKLGASRCTARPTPRTTAAPQPTLTGFSRAPSRPICPSNSRPSSS